MPDVTAVVSIGRNIGDKPMDDAKWARFKHVVSASCDRAGSIVFSATGDGEWQDVPEQSHTYVVAEVGYDAVHQLRLELAEYAWAFHQDAIALTTGYTDFIEGREQHYV